MENTKKCSKCKEIFNISNFTKDKQKKDGLRPICKICDKLTNKKISLKQKEERHKEKNNDYILLEGEEFKEIKNFENYLISNKGRVWSKPTQGGGGFKKYSITNKGYCRITLCKDNKSYPKLLHRLIALHFIENPNNYPIIDHIDRNRLNNNIENLRWCNYELNGKNRCRNGSIFENKRKYNNKEYIYYRVKIGNKLDKTFKTKEKAEEYLKNNIDNYQGVI